MSIGSSISNSASHAVQAAKGVTGYVNHTAGRVGNYTGLTGAFESIAKSAPGQFVGRHKVAAGVVTAGTIATVAYNSGGNHRERLLQARAAQEQGVQR